MLVMVQVNPKAAATEQAMEAELQGLSAFLEQARAEDPSLPPLDALVVQHHSTVANAAAADAPTLPLPGAPGDRGLVIQDSLLDRRFQISTQAFFQVNSGAASVLYSLAGDWALPRGEADAPSNSSRTVLLDVCCGTGTIGITLAGRVGRVIGIDMVASAIDDAKSNAQLNGLTNCEFVCGKAEDVLGNILTRVQQQDKEQQQEPDLVAIVDPPRGGLHPLVLRALLAVSGRGVIP